MSTQLFGRLSQNFCEPSLLITQGGAVVTTQADTLTNARKVMTDNPRGTGLFCFEAFVYSTTLAALGTNFAVGLARVTSSLTAATGGDTLSYGYYPGDGSIKNNGANVASALNWVTAERNAIQVFGNLSSGQINFAVNGAWLAAITIPTGQFYVPSLTVSGGQAGENSIYINTGLTGLFFPLVYAPS